MDFVAASLGLLILGDTSYTAETSISIGEDWRAQLPCPRSRAAGRRRFSMEFGTLEVDFYRCRGILTTVAGGLVAAKRKDGLP